MSLTGHASGGIIHLINSGAATLDATGWHEIDGQPAIKPWWDVTKEEAQKCFEMTTWYPADLGYFRGGGYSSGFLTRGNMPMTMSRINLVKGIGPVLQLAEGWTVDLPEKVHEQLNERTNPTWPTHWFAPNVTGQGAFRDVYTVMANWGANHGALSYGHIGCRFDQHGFHVANPGLYAQCPRRENLPPQHMERLWRKRLYWSRLSRLRKLWSYLWLVVGRKF